MQWLLIVIALFTFLYWKLRRPHSYWTRKGIVQSKPAFLLGDMYSTLLRKLSVPEMLDGWYRMFPNSRYMGVYQFLQPALLLRDPELIKQIGVKDFDYFIDRKGFGAEDPFLSKNLLSLRGQKWREMRSTLSPSFTSSKMKHLFSLISQSGEQFVNYFLKQNQSIVEIEMKDVITKFTNDVIANTVFGFDCDSLEHPENEFYVRAKEATDLTSIRKFVVFMGSMVVPSIIKALKISMFSKKMADFFHNVVKENIASRENSGVKRPDVISLLLEVKKRDREDPDDSSFTLPDTGFATAQESDLGQNQKIRKEKLTDEDIAAQAFIFFFAGFDMVALLMCFMSYELCANRDVQEKLRQEVDETKAKCNGKITYEAITAMKYMDMVVSESLRKWPTGIAIDRICTKPYTIDPKLPEEKPVYLKKNDYVVIPIYGLHRDPQYFPDPDRFDPERFNDENRKNIVPYTFLPFGLGPRNCIGSRFALLEVKILFFYLLSNFELVPVGKTQLPLQLSKKAMNMTAERGFWLGLQRRVK